MEICWNFCKVTASTYVLLKKIFFTLSKKLLAERNMSDELKEEERLKAERLQLGSIAILKVKGNGHGG